MLAIVLAELLLMFSLVLPLVTGLATRPPLAYVARVLLSLLAVFNDDEDCKIFVNVFRKYYIRYKLSKIDIAVAIMISHGYLTHQLASRRNRTWLVSKSVDAQGFSRMFFAHVL